ncbi:MAG: GrpB family protein [bacterium]
MSEIVRFQELGAIEEEIGSLYSVIETKLSTLIPFASIDHIGSTSIPGSVTKGDLDIGLSVPETKFREALSLLDSQYSRNTASLSTDQYQPFIASHGSQEVAIQLFVGGTIFEKRFLFWRDELIKNPGLLSRYNALKLKYEGKAMTEYRDAKSQFIRAYIQDDA